VDDPDMDPDILPYDTEGTDVDEIVTCDSEEDGDIDTDADAEGESEDECDILTLDEWIVVLERVCATLTLNDLIVVTDSVPSSDHDLTTDILARSDLDTQEDPLRLVSADALREIPADRVTDLTAEDV
jgi:hypothetical protein